MKKLVSLVLALMMSLALAVPTGAVGTSGGTGSVPVALTADASTFSVTVPTSIPLSIDGNANVTCPSSLSITNDSAGPVKVTGISVQNGTWTLANYNGGDRSLLASEKVNSSKLGLALWPDGGSKSATSTNGTQNLTIDANQWVIVGNGKSLRFACDAIASAVSSAITTAVHAVDVVFTIGWSASETSSSTYAAPYLTFTSPSAFSMSVKSPGWDGKLEYSTNAEDWTRWNGSSISASNDGGDYTLYFRGSNNTQITGGTYSAHIWTINGTNVQCRGNIETLLDYVTVEDGEHPDMGRYCYRSMFQGCKNLTTAPELPATTLAPHCYANMFNGCTKLTTAPPELPATTLAEKCYANMFQGCTNLTTAPALPATTLADQCYESMFNGCTKLTTAPPELPAATLAGSCYTNMFRDCKSLTTAPALPATTLAENCYSYMFYGCTSLTTAPQLPATTLAATCYQSMFYNCTSLTTAPALPATTLASYCYSSMFYRCTSLTTAPALPATTLAEQCYYDMFHGCTSLTTAPELPATTLANCCYQQMFYACTSLTTAPALPATTLANCCYDYMFYGCTSLTTAPELPATTLAYSCYRYMFSDCTSLKVSATQTEEYTQAYRIPTSGDGTTADDALYGMFTGTGGTFTDTPTINTTYYLHSSNSIVG